VEDATESWVYEEPFVPWCCDDIRDRPVWVLGFCLQERCLTRDGIFNFHRWNAVCKYLVLYENVSKGKGAYICFMLGGSEVVFARWAELPIVYFAVSFEFNWLIKLWMCECMITYIVGNNSLIRIGLFLFESFEPGGKGLFGLWLWSEWFLLGVGFVHGYRLLQGLIRADILLYLRFIYSVCRTSWVIPAAVD
jgi:hypothetical protein